MRELEDRDWRGHEVVDPGGAKIGTVEDFFVDSATERPEWALVNTGLFGLKQTLVPFAGAGTDDQGRLMVSYDKDLVKDAPSLDPHADVSESQEAELYDYYGLDRSGAGPAVTPAGSQAADGTAEDDRDTTVESGAGGVPDDELVQQQAQIDDAEREREAQEEERQQQERERQEQEEERLAHERERLARERELNERESELTGREREVNEREASVPAPAGGDTHETSVPAPVAARTREAEDEEASYVADEQYDGSRDADSSRDGESGDTSSTGAVSRLRRFGDSR